MKKISFIFLAAAIIISNVMCCVVSYNYCNNLWAMKYNGTSAPAEIAFLYIIPFGVVILGCVIASVLLWKKANK